MLLIAIDTSGRNGSIALCRGDENSFAALQVMALEGGTYSARLMPSIAELLANQQLSKAQIDAFVVVSGPGSFTGLRVGLATVKGLCEVLQKPLVAVSMLEAVAIVRGPQNGRVAVALDAGRSEVYVGEFEIANSHATVVREYIAKLEAFAAGAASSKLTVLTPDSKIVEALVASSVSAKQVEAVRADEIARLGLVKFLAGDLADVATLDANYIRRSDAELFLSRSGDAMLIRAAVPEDIAQIMRLAAESETAAHWSAREYDALFAADAPERVALVCETAAGIAGFITARCGGEEWEIENVVVEPELRQQGIGRQLVQGALRQAQSRGAIDVFLEVRESNVAARGLYGRLGFREQGRRPRYYRDPEEDAVLMRLSM